MAELKTRREGAVATILISNIAKKNAMTYDMWAALPREVQALDADPDVRVIVLAGDGDEAFVSGADISQFESLRGTGDAQQAYNTAVEDAYLAPIRCSKPVIARIHGICMGGGLGLAASCDVRICSDRTVFRMPAARLGLGYSPEGIGRFMNVIGAANTADLFLSARKFGAAEALRIGFVSQVHPVADLERAAGAYITMVAENAPLTMAAAKFAIRQSLLDPAERDMPKARAMASACGQSEDHKEGRRAFMEKRTPRFQGR